jgi:hypothetical protein
MSIVNGVDLLGLLVRYLATELLLEATITTRRRHCRVKVVRQGRGPGDIGFVDPR